jgi:hypothetical protein
MAVFQRPFGTRSSNRDPTANGGVDSLVKRRQQVEGKLPPWVSVLLRPADDPMGAIAVGTIVIAAGFLSFRLLKRLRHRPAGSRGR